MTYSCKLALRVSDFNVTQFCPLFVTSYWRAWRYTFVEECIGIVWWKRVIINCYLIMIYFFLCDRKSISDSTPFLTLSVEADIYTKYRNKFTCKQNKDFLIGFVYERGRAVSASRLGLNMVSLSLRDVEAIFQVYSSKSFYEMISWALVLCECNSTLLVTIQHWLR